MVQVDKKPQAWFTMRSTDEVKRLRPGDELAIESFQGTIESIDDHDVIVSSDGERWLLTVGENLTQAVALPPSS